MDVERRGLERGRKKIRLERRSEVRERNGRKERGSRTLEKMLERENQRQFVCVQKNQLLLFFFLLYRLHYNLKFMRPLVLEVLQQRGEAGCKCR